MSFIWSSLLILLLCVPLLAYLYVRLQRRRRAALAQFGSLGTLRDSSGQGASRLGQLPAFLFLSGTTILILSLARPQATLSLPKREGTVILTFDVSGSMSADDIEPTRMEAAKAAARDFVQHQPGNIRLGMVAFSDGGITVQAPTNNREETIAAIERLVPRRGTSIGNGILVALNTIAVDAGDEGFLSTNNLPNPSQPLPGSAPQTNQILQGWYPSAVIVLLTDGENNQEPDPVVVTDLAVDLGVRIYTIGIGSPEGTTITVDGFTVFSQLNESVLQSIAETSGGEYYSAASEEELRKIYSDIEPLLTIKKEEIEITSIFSGAGMILFLIGGLVSLIWFGRVP